MGYHFAGVGHRLELKIEREIHFPHSLGLLYSAFTYYTGFKVNSGEYKIMGLAPYGEPRFAEKIREHLIDIKEDGSYRLNMDYFDYCTGLTMTNAKFDELFGGPPRQPEGTPHPAGNGPYGLGSGSPRTRRIEDDPVHCTGDGDPEPLSRGGVALNCVANGEISGAARSRTSGYSRLQAMPAARSALPLSLATASEEFRGHWRRGW